MRSLEAAIGSLSFVSVWTHRLLSWKEDPIGYACGQSCLLRDISKEPSRLPCRQSSARPVWEIILQVLLSKNSKRELDFYNPADGSSIGNDDVVENPLSLLSCLLSGWWNTPETMKTCRNDDVVGAATKIFAWAENVMVHTGCFVEIGYWVFALLVPWSQLLPGRCSKTPYFWLFAPKWD